MVRIFLSVLLLVFVLAGYASADFYKWEDEEGNIHITDYPPPKKAAKKVKVHATDSNAAPPRPAPAKEPAPPTPSPGTPPVAETRATHEVILYTTSWCPYCRQAKAFFESRGIPYTEYDIEKDPEAAARQKQIGGGVPFAIVNGEYISGYAPGAYDAALRKR